MRRVIKQFLTVSAVTSFLVLPTQVQAVEVSSFSDFWNSLLGTTTLNADGELSSGGTKGDPSQGQNSTDKDTTSGGTKGDPI